MEALSKIGLPDLFMRPQGYPVVFFYVASATGGLPCDLKSMAEKLALTQSHLIHIIPINRSTRIQEK